MYMESVSGINSPGGSAQLAAGQVSKISSRASAKVPDKTSSKVKTPPDKKADKTFMEVSDRLLPRAAAPKEETSQVMTSQVTASNMTASQAAAQKEKAPDRMKDKKEPADVMVGVPASDKADESVTLAIQADKKQLLDEQRNVNMEKLRKIMEQMADSFPNTNAKFGIHEQTDRIMIKLIDRDTQEVIKEFPPEKNLDMLAKSLAMAGVLVDQRL